MSNTTTVISISTKPRDGGKAPAPSFYRPSIDSALLRYQLERSNSVCENKVMQVRLDTSTTALETTLDERDVSQGSEWKLDVDVARRLLSLTSLAGLSMPKHKLAHSGPEM
jgi:hypothetical protein